MPLLGKRHRSRDTGFLRSPAPLPVRFGCAGIGVIQFYDTGKDVVLASLPHSFAQTV